MKPNTDIIGSSDVMVRLRQFALQVAETDITVLITGETGSGKRCSPALFTTTAGGPAKLYSRQLRSNPHGHS